MAALWTYPWTLAERGLEDACESVASSGIDAVNLSSHYHSVRSMEPATPDGLFRQYPGGCHFRPASGRFDETPVEPPVVDVDGLDDPLGDVAPVARDHGLSVNAWTVVLHNSRLGATNPDYRIESAFGDAHEHSLCPSHPAVRTYFAAVVEELVARSLDEIQLESMGFPTAFHGHGWEYGHDKRQVLTSFTERVLLSQCFCDGCRSAAADHRVDLEAASERVRSILEASFADPHADPPALAALVREDETLEALFDFRAAVVESLFERLADAAGSTPMNYYVMEDFGGAEPGGGWPAGVRLGRLDEYIDRATAICYVADPSVARARVRTLRRSVDATVDAGVTLAPSIVDSAGQLDALAAALLDAVDGRLHVYHYSLLTDAQLEWIADSLDR